MHTEPDGGTRRIGPLDVRAQSRDAAIAAILAALAERRVLKVGFANTNLLYHALRDDALATQLAGFHLLNDGVGLSMLARLACGESFVDNLNGTDFTPALLGAAPAGARIFLLGARRRVMEAAGRRLAQRFPDLVFCGGCDGFSVQDDPAYACAVVSAAHADIVLVAMGNPLQERWIATLAAQSSHGVFIGVGALFDFLADDKPRAPALLRLARLEWLFRLALEPQRLWRRYTIEFGAVLLAVTRQRARSMARRPRARA